MYNRDLANTDDVMLHTAKQYFVMSKVSEGQLNHDSNSSSVGYVLYASFGMF